MSIKILTLEDLNEFKSELLGDIQNLMAEPQNEKPKKWIKSSEVRKMLSISAGTLQNLRINGTLPYTKFGSVIYYNAHLINEILESNHIQGS
ncbi:helix-turn-helix domain-containing protein [Tamlana sp. s12]|uniref:Helix-turn-helix domain-containing protein n=2 Tax=Pseudotamlana TaxID=3400368 RepID=A0A6N6MHI6_9FLAO|nr:MULTISPECIES: helix-turn-helix domain-containing protein [Tamlana]AUS05951.1 DNA-binding protein [Tamlana carrageenivorans]KAB1068971.1 helix-turn-helix domain-containing protein [Tamlana haliotis]OBQ54745.1 transcriptional regulator [Tamlana sp. s12]QQY82237.1 helix-turn-helix domain-containing protein [Tamlana sp. s12]